MNSWAATGNALKRVGVLLERASTRFIRTAIEFIPVYNGAMT